MAASRCLFLDGNRPCYSSPFPNSSLSLESGQNTVKLLGKESKGNLMYFDSWKCCTHAISSLSQECFINVPLFLLSTIVIGNSSVFSFCQYWDSFEWLVYSLQNCFTNKPLCLSPLALGTKKGVTGATRNTNYVAGRTHKSSSKWRSVSKTRAKVKRFSSENCTNYAVKG